MFNGGCTTRFPGNCIKKWVFEKFHNAEQNHAYCEQLLYSTMVITTLVRYTSDAEDFEPMHTGCQHPLNADDDLQLHNWPAM